MGGYTTPDSAPTGYVCRVLRIPADSWYLAAIGERLAYLCEASAWESVPGTVPPEDAASAMALMLVDYYNSECEVTSIPTGTVIAYSGSVPPEGWLLCDGQQVNEESYPDLESHLRNNGFVVSGRTVTPDLRSRFILGSGQGDGLTARSLGAALGTETVTLTKDQMPEHDHLFKIASQNYWSPDGMRVNAATTSGDYTTQYTTASGGGAPHNNMPPAIVLTYIIKT